MKPSLILFVILLTVAGCKNQKSTAPQNPSSTAPTGVPGSGNGGVGIRMPQNPQPAKPENVDEKKSQKENPVREIQVVPGMKLGKSNPFSFGSVVVNGDSLLIAVQYSGGCKEHEWNLYTTGSYSKTYPPKLELHLHHNSNEDFCKAMIRETLIFDLKKIRYEGSKVVELQLFDFVDFVTYSY